MMKTPIENISLIMATISLAVIFVAGMYERITNITKWFADPPSSFSLINRHTKAALRFWIPVQILFFASYITALVTNWDNATIRNYVILTGVSYVFIIVMTASYFAKEIMAFSKMSPDEPATPELKERAGKWLKWTGLRNVLQGIGLLFLLLAL